MEDRKLTSVLVWISISLFAAVVSTELFLSQRNILAFKKDWQLATLEFLNPTIVSVPVYTSPYVMNGYRLKSTDELGTIRILSEKAVTPERVEFRFRVGDEGFVDFIFNAGPEGHKFVRFSRNNIYTSGVNVAGADEKFIPTAQSTAMTGYFDDPQRLQTVVFRKGSMEHDGVVQKHEGIHLSSGKVGVQVSPENAEVFSLDVKTPEGNHRLHFFPEGDRLALGFRHWLIILGLVFALGFIPGFERTKIVCFLAGAFALLLIADVVIGIDTKKNPQGLRAKFEILDRWWRPSGEKSLEEKLKALKKDDSDSVKFLCTSKGCGEVLTKSPLPPSTGERILIFGGSQSKYGLIRDYRESFHFRFDGALRKLRPDVETINLSTPGFFQDRVRAYGPAIENVNPDTIIIESLATDLEKSALRQFISGAMKRGKKVILLRPPQNVLSFSEDELPFFLNEMRKGLESKAADLPGERKWLALRNLAFYRETMKDLDYSFLDPNAIFLDEGIMQSGQIFWDSTHLTIYGQQLLAEWLAGEVAKLD